MRGPRATPKDAGRPSMWWPVQGGALWAGPHPGSLESGLQGSGMWWAGSEPSLARHRHPCRSRRPQALTRLPRPRGGVSTHVVSVHSGFKHSRTDSGCQVANTSLCLVGRGPSLGISRFDHQTLEAFLPVREWITASPAWWLGKLLRRLGTGWHLCTGVCHS